MNIPISFVGKGNTYLKTPGQIRPQDSYDIVNVNDQAGKEVNYSVTFRITEACDLACSYCHWHDGRNYAYEDIITSIDKLFEFFQKQKFSAVVFYYHGGEATRHKNIVEVLKHIKDKSKETGIIAYNEMQTNLTVKEDRLRAIIPYCDLFNVTIHYLELKKRQYKLDAFCRNWKILVEEGVEVHNFDVMLEYIPEDQLQEFYDIVEDCLSYHTIVNSEMVYRFGYNYNFNEETAVQHKQFYDKHNKTEQVYNIDGKLYNTNDLFKDGLDCTGWHCGAGTESITINGDGNVFNCGIQMTGYIRNHTEIPFTNLVTDKLAVTKMSVLHSTGTRCRWDYCGGDFYLSKRKTK
jgi:hypothetical protein